MVFQSRNKIRVVFFNTRLNVILLSIRTGRTKKQLKNIKCLSTDVQTVYSNRSARPRGNIIETFKTDVQEMLSVGSKK